MKQQPLPSRDGGRGGKSARAATIQLKLSAVIVALVVGVVTLMAGMFITIHVRGLEAGLCEKAKTYAELVARESSSAVAFDDRQTAREAFDAISVDDDVTGVALYGANGAMLESRGELVDAAATQPPPGSLTVRRIGGVIEVLTAVVSREGPRGALVLDLSNAAVTDAKHHAIRLTVAWGVCAIALGLLAAWFIARSIARRLSVLARAATAVTNGELDPRPIVDGSKDEIGSLVTSFNAMWVKLRSLLDEVQRSAREDAARLDALVEARTAELDHRNAEMRLVLDHVEQGLVTLDPAGHVGSERSRVADSWFGPAAPGTTLWDWLLRDNDAQRRWFSTAWEQVREGSLPIEVSLDQLPTTFEAAGRCFALTYRPLLQSEGLLSRMLVVITDQTAVRARERAERERRELSDIAERFQRDRDGVMEFFADARKLTEAFAFATTDTARAHALHTLKGTTAMMGLEGFSRVCHEAETALAEASDEDRAGRSVEAAAAAILRQRWREVEQRFAMFSEQTTQRFEADQEDYEALLQAIDGHAPHVLLRQLAERFRYERVEVRLSRLAEQASRLAERLGKAPLLVRVEANDVRLPRHALAQFWSASVHTVRNAVDHGFEEADATEGSIDRHAEARPAGAADILLRASEGDDGEGFEIEIRDFGRGIDWERLQRSAARLGHPSERRQDLIEALFKDGVTTKETITSVSGRGAGLGAAREACEELGGSVRVTSEPGQGTSFIFHFPSAARLPPNSTHPPGPDAQSTSQ